MSFFIFLKRGFILFVLFICADFLLSSILLNGLNKYYGFRQNPEILINGSSMAESGFNREEIEKQTKMQIASYTHEGVSINDRYAMISYFFHMYPEAVKTVVYEVNPVLFSNLRTAENVYTILYPYMDDKTVNKYIKENADIKEYYARKIIRTKRFESRLIRLIAMGYLGKYDNLKTNILDTTLLSPLIAQKGKTEVIMEKSNVEVFENTMDLIRSHNSNIILVMMPMYYLKFQTFNEQGYANLCKYLEDYSSSREGIKFLDFNRDSIIFKADYFSDQLHFNVYGQRYNTKMISSQIMLQNVNR